MREKIELPKEQAQQVPVESELTRESVVDAVEPPIDEFGSKENYEIFKLYQEETVGKSWVAGANKARLTKPSLDAIESRRDKYPNGKFVGYQAYKGKFPSDIEGDK